MRFSDIRFNGNGFYRFRDNYLYPIVFIGPTIGFLVMFIAFPLIYSIVISFHEYNLSRATAPVWNGLANYQHIFADPILWRSIRITLFYSGSVTVVGFLLGFGTALLLVKRRALNVYISLLLLPVTVPPIVAGFMFRVLLNKSYGPVEYYFTALGLSAPNWIASPVMAPITLSLVGIWSNFPLIAIIMVGGLSSVPKDLYEAAEIDGANAHQRLFKITIPVLKPIMVSVAILTIINTMKVYDEAVTLTSGGPGTATRTITYYANVVGFQTYDLGRAAASSLIIFALILVLTALISLSALHGRDING
jgi:multiple sugar transport system permease protein